jgi:hypothetical protein
MIISNELSPLILIPISWFKTRMLSVTIAIDRPKDNATLSKIFTRRKKTSVQVKPGTKNTKMKPKIPLMAGKASPKDKIDLKNSLIGCC